MDPLATDHTELSPATALPDVDDSPAPIAGRLSAGLEVYYGLLNKGGGRKLSIPFLI